MSIGYSGTELVEDDGMGHGNVNVMHTALYAAWQPRKYLHVDTALGWGYDWFKNNRPIYMFNRMADSSHTGQELMTYLGAGIDYPVGKWTIGPQAAIQYVHVDQNNFQEQNAGDLGLLVNAQGADSFQTRIGLETARPFTMYGHNLIPRLRVDWLHEYCGAIRTVPARFSGAPDVVFLAPGRRYQIDGAIVGGGIDAHLSDSITAYLNYDVPFLGDSNIISGYSLWLGIGANF
jgi:outer membrane autotransporter protein